MEIIIYILLIILAFYVVTKVVDEYFINSLDNIAGWLKLTPSVAGATLLAIGTSAPEISITMFALFLEGSSPAIGLGTVVGSAIFQILVVIGFASLVKTTYLDWKPVLRDCFFYLISVIELILIVQDGVIYTQEALVMVATYLIYLVTLVWWSRKFKEETTDPIEVVEKEISQRKAHPVRRAAGLTIDVVTKPIDFVLNFIPDASKNKRATLPVFFLSLVLIAGASYVLVEAASAMALLLGVSEVILGLTLLAGGSSLPELISSYIISKQGRGDMAISNAIGSNTFDILVSLGLPVLIYTVINAAPAPSDSETIVSSLFLLFATLLSVLGMLAVQRFKIGRKFGIVLIAGYVAYVVAAYMGVI